MKIGDTMINIYKTNEENKIIKLESIERNSWINLIAPTAEEIKEVVEATGFDEELMIKLLDEEEFPRVEVGDNATLIVMDVPYIEDKRQKNKYNTIPVGILVGNNDYVVTISTHKTEIFNDFFNGKIKNLYTSKKSRFIILLSYKISLLYIRYLRSIDKEIENKEDVLSKTTDNEELISLLSVEKSLVYFITALKANDVILEKFSKGNIITLFEEDLDLLDDAMIENKQGIEMASIYNKILSSTSETYGTIISNNLNGVMKFLASITIVFYIPTIIFSFLGMNISLGDISTHPLAAFIIAFIALIISLIAVILLKRRKLL